MKRLLFLTIFISVCYVGSAENRLTLSTVSGHPGDTLTMTVSMTNVDSVSAMQFFIPLGSQLRYVASSAMLSSRSTGHVVSATVLNDTLRIYIYSLSLNTYASGNGVLVSFRVVLGNEPVTYSLPLCSAMLSSALGGSIPVQTTAGSVTILAPKISLTYGTYQAGMLTCQIDYGHCPIRSSYTRTVTIHNVGNEPLTVSDVTFDHNALSVSEMPTNQIAAGGQWSVTVNYLPVTAGSVTLHGAFHSNARVGDSLLTILADPYSVNELRPLSVSGYTDSIVTVQLQLNNMDSIVALQTSIKLPEALTYVDGSFMVNSSRSQDHTASAGLLGDTLTMLITSMQNKPLRDGDGVVASFQLRLHGYGSHTLRLLQTALADTNGHNVMSAVYTGSVSIYSPTLDCSNTLNLGTTSVTDTAVAAFAVNNNGNASLVIDQVLFSSDSFYIQESMPFVVNNYQNATLHVCYTGKRPGDFSVLMQVYNNDPRNTLMQVTVKGHRFEPNALYMSTDFNSSLDNAKVRIMLDNYSTVTALQMDVVYPHTYTTVGTDDFLLTERSNGHAVSKARQNDSTWRVLLFSMNNDAFIGHEGSVLDVKMNLIDTNDLGQYPIRLQNVLVANATGTSVLSYLDSISYIATRIIHDTSFIHDTTVVYEMDTVFVTDFDTLVMVNYVYDTVVEIDYVYDTVIITNTDTLISVDYVHDTTFITLYEDTVFLVEYIHDTTTMTVYEDTLYFWQHDTTVVYYPDTVFVDNYIFDTTILTFYDTAWLWQYDTTILTIHDTSWLWQYDTTILTIHDTSWLWQYDTTILTMYDTTYISVHDTTVEWFYDTVYLTEYIHDTTDIYHYIYDTAIVTIHDTTWSTITIRDTIVEPIVFYDLVVSSNNVERGIGVGSGHFSEGSTVEVAGIPTAGNKFLQWADGGHENPRTVVLTQNTNIQAVFVSVDPNYIEEESHQWEILYDGSNVQIDNLMGEDVRIMDVVGRVLQTYLSAVGTIRFSPLSTGCYFVQVGSFPAKKVVIKR